MNRGAWLDRPQYLFFDYSASETCSFLRCRLGSHYLQIDLGRWFDKRPRANRVCPRCTLCRVDDEQHMIFQCSGLDSVRASHQSLFSLDVGRARCT